MNRNDQRFIHSGVKVAIENATSDFILETTVQTVGLGKGSFNSPITTFWG